MSKARRTLLGLPLLCQVLLVTGIVRAEDPAAAEVLFREGRSLLADGKVAAACEKLKESFALDPMSGTLLNLADCYEKDGRTATAWARFRNAASLAKSQGKLEQATEADRRAKALEGELSYVTIVVPEPVPGLEVQRADVEVPPAMFGVEVPIDPGRVQVVASAPGYKSVRLAVEIGARRDKRIVTIPKLESANLPAETAAGVASPAEGKLAPNDVASSKPSQADRAERTVALEPTPTNGPGLAPWVIGGIGVAAAATGGVFGYLATRSDKEATEKCPSRTHCSSDALELVDRRDQQATLANIGVGLGLVGIATAGVWMLVDRPKRVERAATTFKLRPTVAKGSASLWAIGEF